MSRRRGDSEESADGTSKPRDRGHSRRQGPGTRSDPDLCTADAPPPLVPPPDTELVPPRALVLTSLPLVSCGVAALSLVVVDAL